MEVSEDTGSSDRLRLTGKANKAEGESLNVLGWVSPIGCGLGGGFAQAGGRPFQLSFLVAFLVVVPFAADTCEAPDDHLLKGEWGISVASRTQRAHRDLPTRASWLPCTSFCIAPSEAPFTADSERDSGRGKGGLTGTTWTKPRQSTTSFPTTPGWRKQYNPFTSHWAAMTDVAADLSSPPCLRRQHYSGRRWIYGSRCGVHGRLDWGQP
jgi:hypothetical protein